VTGGINVKLYFKYMKPSKVTSYKKSPDLETSDLAKFTNLIPLVFVY